MGFKGSRLRELREARGLTQAEFGAKLFDFEQGGRLKCAPTKQQVTAWERGNSPCFPTALRIARFFGVAAEELDAPDEADKGDEDDE